VYLCPQDLLPLASDDLAAEGPDSPRIIRLAPPLAQTVKAVVTAVKHLRFKSSAIITAGKSTIQS